MRLLLLFTLLISLQVSAQSNPKSLVIGEQHIIQSTYLKEDRTLNVYLPAYYDSSKTYPVLYVLDGGLDEDFMHIAGLTQFHNMMFGLPDMIVVGIVNVDRRRDFTFATTDTALQREFPTTGHSAEFIGFLEKEMLPYIRNTFHVNDTAMLIGQSLGGLLATEILLNKPQLFSHYFIVSPSLWWDNESLLDSMETKLLHQQNMFFGLTTGLPQFVFIAVGANEEKVMRNDAKKFYRTYRKAYFTNTALYFQKMRDEDHATILHNAIYKGFLFLKSAN